MDLSPDFEYDPGKTWWEQFTAKISRWWSSIPAVAKVVAGAVLIAASIVIAYYTGGASLGAGSKLLGGRSAATTAAKTALIEVSIGIGFATAGWVISSAISGEWSLGELENGIADAVFTLVCLCLFLQV